MFQITCSIRTKNNNNLNSPIILIHLNNHAVKHLKTYKALEKVSATFNLTKEKEKRSNLLVVLTPGCFDLRSF